MPVPAYLSSDAVTSMASKVTRCARLAKAAAVSSVSAPRDVAIRLRGVCRWYSWTSNMGELLPYRNVRPKTKPRAVIASGINTLAGKLTRNGKGRALRRIEPQRSAQRVAGPQRHNVHCYLCAVAFLGRRRPHPLRINQNSATAQNRSVRRRAA